MDSKGWIKVYRGWLDNPVLWADSDHIAIWMYLLKMAQYTEQPGFFKGEPITIKPGQLITGRKAISTATKCNESKIYRVLKKFENAQLIEQQTSNKCSLISILKPTDNSESEQQNEQQMNNNRTTSEQQVNTNKDIDIYKNNYLDISNDMSIVEQDSTPDIKTLVGATTMVMDALSEIPEFNNDNLTAAVMEWLKYLNTKGCIEFGAEKLLAEIYDEESCFRHYGAENAIKAIRIAIAKDTFVLDCYQSLTEPNWG